MNQGSRPKIVVVGAGAVGSVVGGLLARQGEDVTLIARRAHAEAINNNGLHIDGAAGIFTVSVPAKEALDFKPDLVLLAVKSQDVETVCRQIEPYVTGVPVVMLQNGVRSDEIAASVLGRENIIGGVVMFNARFLNPGQVTYSVKGFILISEAFQENGERIREIWKILNRATMTRISYNITGVRWTKLLVNIIGNSLEAMTGLSFGECMKNADLRRIGILITKEAFEVAEKTGVYLESLPGLPISAFRLTIKSPMAIASLVLRLTMSTTDTVTSTLQSIRRGKPTEIDYLNGEIVAQGKRLGIPTPYNTRVVELVHEIEQTGQFYSPAELAHRFSGG